MEEIIYKNKLIDLTKLLEDKHKNLKIIFCGRFKSGKTSLINLLLNTNLPVKATSATGVITKILYSGKPSYVCDNSVNYVDEEELKKLILIKDKSKDGVDINKIDEVKIISKSNLLKHGLIEIWDSPGLEDDDELTCNTLTAINECDFVIYVLSSIVLLSYKEKKLIERLYEQFNGNIIFVVNQFDRIVDKDKVDFVNRVYSRLKSYSVNSLGLNNIIFTSAHPNNSNILPLIEIINKLSDSYKNFHKIKKVSINGKANFILNNNKEEINQDIEKLNNNINRIELEKKENIKNKQDNIEKEFFEIKKYLEIKKQQFLSSINNESLWKLVIRNYKKEPNWHLSFSSGIKNYIINNANKIVNDFNVMVKNKYNDTAFSNLFDEFLLNFINWDKTYFHHNYKPTALFNSKFLNKFSIECEEKTITHLMNNEVKIITRMFDEYMIITLNKLNKNYIKLINNTQADQNILTSLYTDKNILEQINNNLEQINNRYNKIINRNNKFLFIDFLYYFIKKSSIL